jgi:hypothetical protein
VQDLDEEIQILDDDDGLVFQGVPNRANKAAKTSRTSTAGTSKTRRKPAVPASSARTTVTKKSNTVLAAATDSDSDAEEEDEEEESTDARKAERSKDLSGDPKSRRLYFEAGVGVEGKNGKTYAYKCKWCNATRKAGRTGT